MNFQNDCCINFNRSTKEIHTQIFEGIYKSIAEAVFEGMNKNTIKYKEWSLNKIADKKFPMARQQELTQELTVAFMVELLKKKIWQIFAEISTEIAEQINKTNGGTTISLSEFLFPYRRNFQRNRRSSIRKNQQKIILDTNAVKYL